MDLFSGNILNPQSDSTVLIAVLFPIKDKNSMLLFEFLSCWSPTIRCVEVDRSQLLRIRPFDGKVSRLRARRGSMVGRDAL